MNWCKPEAEYVQRNAVGVLGPRNGHWSYRHHSLELDSAETAAEAALAHAWGFDRNISVDDFKQNIVALAAATPVEPNEDLSNSYLHVPVRDGTKIELKVYRTATSRNPNGSMLLLRLHGGGWVVGCHETEETENRMLAALPDVVLVSVDYRMAPEFPFPTPVNDCFDVLQWCQRNGREILQIDPQRIMLVGCSAGANLAAAVSSIARDKGISGIIGQHLAIPVTCHPKLFCHVPNREHMELLSWSQNHDAPLVDARRMEVFWDLYVGPNPDRDPLHSPLLAKDLKGLPPTCLQIAGRDPLRDEGIAYGEALEAAGVETEIFVYSGLPHGFAGFENIPESKEYFERLKRFVRRCGEAIQETGL